MAQQLWNTLIKWISFIQTHLRLFFTNGWDIVTRSVLQTFPDIFSPDVGTWLQKQGKMSKTRENRMLFISATGKLSSISSPLSPSTLQTALHPLWPPPKHVLTGQRQSFISLLQTHGEPSAQQTVAQHQIGHGLNEHSQCNEAKLMQLNGRQSKVEVDSLYHYTELKSCWNVRTGLQRICTIIYFDWFLCCLIFELKWHLFFYSMIDSEL